MKNVLQVINLYQSAKVFIGGQFQYLNANGYKMHLMCSPHDELPRFAKYQGFSYQPVEFDRQLNPVKDLRAFIQLCKYIRRNKIDIIIGHQAKARLLTVLAGRLMGVPQIIIYSHGALHECARGYKRKLIILESAFESMLAHKVVCVSDSVRAIRIREKIDRPSKQFMLNKGTCCGVDSRRMFNPERVSAQQQAALRTRLGIKENEYIVGFCGRLVKDKGIVELVEAFRKLQKAHPAKYIKLLIIGPAEKRDSISAETFHYLNTSDKVAFTGFVNHDEIPAYYSLMNVLLLPSYREGFPTVVLEAAAMEVPAIVSGATGCIDAVIPGKTGLRCEIEAESIKTAIEQLLDPAKAKTMGRAARRYVSAHYDHSVVWPALLPILQNQ